MIENDILHEAPKRARRAGGRRADWVVATVAVFGIGVLLYPAAAQWFSARDHASDVSGYVNAASSIPSEEREALLRAAHDYNRHLPQGPLRDPYAIAEDGSAIEVAEIGEEYYSQLRVDAVDSMARITIPSAEIDLPVYHSTDDATLMRGAGHLFGTSLPVGGASTHSVITAHSGIPQSELFTNLDEVEMGDTFTVSVLGEQLTYQVDQIVVVEPNDARELEVVAGQDYVTLISCTPTGVNTHRLLVRGTRIETPTAEGYMIPGQGVAPGFPWWALGMGAGLVGASAFVIAGNRRRQPKTATDTDAG